MTHRNWNTAYNIGGLFEYFLDVLPNVERGGQSSCMPPHCGKCDAESRQMDEPSFGADGKLTYDCLTCHPNQVRLRGRLTQPRKSTVLELALKRKELPEQPTSLNLDDVFKSVNEYLDV